MVVAESRDGCVQIPEDRDTGGVLKAAVIGDVTQSHLRNGILLDRKTIVEIDPEIAHENVEGKLGSRVHKDAIGIVTRVIHVEGVADPQVQLEGIELGDGPKGVDVHLRADDEIALLLSSYQNGPDWARGQRQLASSARLMLSLYSKPRVALNRSFIGPSCRL